MHTDHSKLFSSVRKRGCLVGSDVGGFPPDRHVKTRLLGVATRLSCRHRVALWPPVSQPVSLHSQAIGGTLFRADLVLWLTGLCIAVVGIFSALAAGSSRFKRGKLVELPTNLLHAVRDGDVVLVLGAGASIGATGPNGETSPTGPKLARMIADRFLPGEFADESLAVVSELAVSESDLRTVQDFVASIFEPLQPAAFHLLLSEFKWAALATTNFDLVVERAYSQSRRSAQDVVPFLKDGDRVASKLRDPRGLMYLKLHGCITNTADTQVPLILSVDQYVTHRVGRQRLFNHLIEKAHELPLVFVGHSLRDPDIRGLLLELGSPDSRPLFYAVAPNVTSTERRFWEHRRVAPLDGTFEEFLTSLDHQVTSPLSRGRPGSYP